MHFLVLISHTEFMIRLLTVDHPPVEFEDYEVVSNVCAKFNSYASMKGTNISATVVPEAKSVAIGTVSLILNGIAYPRCKRRIIASTLL